jgi:hypothetical protein
MYPDHPVVDGVYVTTRGCSTKQWEDVDAYFDHRNQDLRCFRRGSVEQCLCQKNSCNHGIRTLAADTWTVMLAAAAITVASNSVSWRTRLQVTSN